MSQLPLNLDLGDLAHGAGADVVSDPVRAATAWSSNADMVVDLVRLGYLRPEWLTIDPTYGRGNWWKRWKPDHLIAHDLDLDAVDFRQLPEGDASADAVAFDPPYVATGGRSTTGMPDFAARYGLTDAPRTPALLQDVIDAGMKEQARVLRPRGVLLVKCQDYTSSGRYWPGTHHTLTTALALGFELQDRLEHVGSPRAQPSGRVQCHARRNLSTLFVLLAPK